MSSRQHNTHLFTRPSVTEGDNAAGLSDVELVEINLHAVQSKLPSRGQSFLLTWQSIKEINKTMDTISK